MTMLEGDKHLHQGASSTEEARFKPKNISVTVGVGLRIEGVGYGSVFSIDDIGKPLTGTPVLIRGHIPESRMDGSTLIHTFEGQPMEHTYQNIVSVEPEVLLAPPPPEVIQPT